MSKTISCLIVDDEKNAHYVLQNYITRHSDLVLAGQYYNAATALAYLQDHHADLIFLDINMPDQNGFELMATLNTPVKIILTTAYSDFALKAYDYGVLDYLVKPIPYPRFELAIQRYQENSAARESSAEVLEDDFITLKTDDGMVNFPLEEIVYLQSWGNYIKLYTEDQTYLCTATTTEVERRLPKNGFIRIHKSYIVAIRKVEDFKGDMVLLRQSEINLPVGITYRRILAEIFKG